MIFSGLNMLKDNKNNSYIIERGNRFKKKVEPSVRALLIRRGNDFFSSGNIKAAEKIFVTTDYKDGIVRLGDYYFTNKNIYKAAEMYFMSGNESKIKLFSEKCAKIIQIMLEEEKY